MTHVRSWLLLSLTVLLATAWVSTAEAQNRRGRRGMRGSFIGLLSNEAVQKELKLNDDQIAKVKEIGDQLRSEMREQYGKLRGIEDNDKRRAKMTELREESDEKVREQISELLPREKMMRLYQIRLQVRGAVFGLNHRYIAGRLKLTDEQKTKAAELQKATQEKIYGSFSGMRDMSNQQRRELFTKIRKIRTDADAKALELLTDEQKETYKKLQGEKFEF